MDPKVKAFTGVSKAMLLANIYDAASVIYFESMCPFPSQELGGRGGIQRERPTTSAENEIHMGEQAPIFR
jgi:hypothetical protein